MIVYRYLAGQTPLDPDETGGLISSIVTQEDLNRFEQENIFPNGNGRHARLCADVMVSKYHGQKLSWGSHSNLTPLDEIRKRYIAALREADRGDYEPLLAFAIS